MEAGSVNGHHRITESATQRHLFKRSARQFPGFGLAAIRRSSVRSAASEPILASAATASQWVKRPVAERRLAVNSFRWVVPTSAPMSVRSQCSGGTEGIQPAQTMLAVVNSARITYVGASRDHQLDRAEFANGVPASGMSRAVWAQPARLIPAILWVEKCASAFIRKVGSWKMHLVAIASF